MTAANILCLNPPAVAPGQGLDPGTGFQSGASELEAATVSASGFARLVDAMIGGNSLAPNEFLSVEAACSDTADQTESRETESGEDDSSQPERPDLMLVGVFVLPVPVPIQVPKTELGTDLGFNLEPDEAECAATLASAAATVPPTGMIARSTQAPVISDVQEQSSTAELIPAGHGQVPDAAGPVAKREPNAQPLAFALRLTDLDKRTQNRAKADPVAAQAAGESKPPTGTVVSAATRGPAAPSGLVAGNIAVASVKALTGDEAAAHDGTERGGNQKVAEQPQPTGAPLTAAAVMASNPGAGSRGDSPPSADGQSGTLTAARAQGAERVITSRVETVQPRAARDIVIQIPVENSRKVEVQVAEQAGEVRVAVRTADPELNQALRVELGSLVNRLETAGYRADSLAASESSVLSSSAARQDPSSSEQPGSRGFSGQWQGQGQGSNGQGSNGQRRQEPETSAWAEQFSNSLTPEHETGQENKSWQSIFRR